MKIVHLMLGNFFIDNYSYQENMLPKFHKKLGFEVEVIASLQTFDKHGKVAYYSEPSQYINENNVLVTRLAYKAPVKFYRKLRRYIGVRAALEKANPDILFIHGCQFLDVDVVVSYLKKHKKVRVYVDNHGDFYNSATNWISKKILHGIIWRRCAHKIEPFTTKFYGVLPARVDFLKNVYGLPPEKCELLVMGADDDFVEAASNPEVKKRIREKYGITEGDFLVMTGGKIDQFRPETLSLMKSVIALKECKVRLLVFGVVAEELKEEFSSLCKNECVIYAGWQSAEMTYQYMGAADLIVFPGLHSVMWEQAVALGIPCLFRKIDGFDHVDIGGNCRFIKDVSVDGIRSEIQYILDNRLEYENMRRVAKSKGMQVFSYRQIAAKSIEQ